MFTLSFSGFHGCSEDVLGNRECVQSHHEMVWTLLIGNSDIGMYDEHAHSIPKPLDPIDGMQ